MDKGFTVEVTTEAVGGGFSVEYFLVLATSPGSAEKFVRSALGEVERVVIKTSWEPHDHFVVRGARMMSVGKW